jgi:hypothetical protein
MPIKTQVRTGQVTGSFGVQTGKITDQLANAATGSIAAADLTDTLSHVVSSIKRIHGGLSFSESAPGTFHQTLLPGSDDLYDLGSAAAAWQDLHLEGDVLMTDAGKVSTAAGDLEIESAAAAVQINGAQATTAGVVLHAEHATSGVEVKVNNTVELIVTGSKVSVESTAEASSAATGALVVKGGAGIAKDLHVGDDLVVGSNAAVITLGSDQTFVLTHANQDSTAVVSSGDRLAFGDAGEYIVGDGTDLKIVASNDASIETDNNLLIDAKGTDAGDGVKITLGDDTANTKLKVHNNSDAEKFSVDALGDVSVGRDLSVTRNVVITGNLDVNGSTTTIDTENLTVQDSIIALGVSGSGAYSATGDRGILFPRGTDSSKVAGLFTRNGSNFELGKSLTGPTSGSFATIAASDYSQLKLGTVIPGADSTYDLGLDGQAYANVYADNVDLSGQGRLDLDTNGDTSIRSPSDDIITFEVGASDRLHLSASVLAPNAPDGVALGRLGFGFKDMFLASGGVINFDNDDVTVTHSANLLSVAGGNTRVQRLEVDGATNFIDVGVADSNDLVIAAADDLQIQAAEIFVSGAIRSDLDGIHDIGALGTKFNAVHAVTLSGSGATAVVMKANSDQKIKKLGTSGDLIIQNGAASGKIIFRDKFFDSSTYADGGDKGIPLANTTAEIDAFETAFGSEKSIIGALSDGRGQGKFTNVLTGTVAAGATLTMVGLNTGLVAEADRSRRIDVFVNGQLLLSGASGANDYFLAADGGGAVTDIKFNFNLVEEDIVAVTAR